MEKKFVWPPHIGEMGDVIKEYIDSGKPLSIADDSGIYGELEEKFAKIHGKKYALVVSSGTMALYSAFFGIDLKPEDEVICTAFSYHATAAPLVHFGVGIKFCDVEPDTGNIDVDKIRSLITEKTKAIITNDQWGHPCDKDKILEICDEYNLRYIEDCSHAHFSKYKGRYTGTFGDVACFSFQGNKLLSGGEGGILITDNQDIYERAVLLGHNLKRPKNSVKNPEYKPLERTGYGLKLRMHVLSAVMINHQLDNYVFDWVDSRRETLEYFEKRLREETFLSPMKKRGYVTSMGAWYGFKPMADFEALGLDRKEFVGYLKDKGLEIKIPGSEVIPSYELFTNEEFKVGNFSKKIDIKEYPMAMEYSRQTVSIPTFTFREYEVIDRYIEVINEYYKEKKGENYKEI